MKVHLKWLQNMPFYGGRVNLILCVSQRRHSFNRQLQERNKKNREKENTLLTFNKFLMYKIMHMQSKTNCVQINQFEQTI